MAKIPRVYQKLFGSTAGPTEIGKFGSLAAGAIAYATTIAEAMELANFEAAWFAAILGNNKPAIEDMNALFYIAFQQVAYCLQAGVPEWNIDTEYCTESLVQSNNIIYRSLTNANTGNLTSDTTKWKVLASNPLTTLGDTMYSAANGVPTRMPAYASGGVAMKAQDSGTNAPVWRPLLTPVVSKITATGAFTYNLPYYFLITAGSATAGATYTNNGNTFTVGETIAAGTLLMCFGNGAPATSGTLTKSGGTGDSTITFSAFAKPIGLKTRGCAAGGGGAGAGVSGGTGGTGGNTTFGASITATGGAGGVGVNGAGGAGGSTSGISTTRGFGVPGGRGGGSPNATTAQKLNSGGGGSNPFGGAPGGSVGGANAPAANTGAGGEGGSASTDYAGAGGGAGGYWEEWIPNPAATYTGSIGAGGTAGTGSPAGSAGSDGVAIVEAVFQ